MKPLFFLFLISLTTIHGLENEFLGCFQNIPKTGSIYVSQVRILDNCAKYCFRNYYWYLNFYNDNCTCSNFLGEQISNVTCDTHCLKNQCSKDVAFKNTYRTGNIVPGPPRGFQIFNITSNNCRLLWKKPESYVKIDGYKITAVIVQTFSSYPPNLLEWWFGNTTFQTELSDLLPATKYNISIAALYENMPGAQIYQIIITRLGDPENLPAQPKILSDDGDKIRIKIFPVVNNNGPVTSYRVVVVKTDDNQGFQKQNVFPYAEAQKQNLSYYIAAELSPQDINQEFTVGDGKYYDTYFNAPLNPDSNYKVIVGLVSNFSGETKSVYSNASGYHNGISILNVYEEEGDSPGVIIGLSIAIALLSLLLIIGVIGFVILKSKIIKRRQRLSENQELTIQGPMIEVENNGYIHDEEHIPAIAHYRNLKQKVRTIPYSQIKVEPANLLGVGKFGKINTGTLHDNGNMTTVTCYTIHDKRMNQETKKGMLQELDILIKIGKHNNIVNLIGTSETRDVVVVVLELNQINLKDFLLGSRDNLSSKFCTMTEAQALEIAIGICRGMTHLHSHNVIHKQLCARNVLISNNLTPKLSGFGLAQYFSHNKIPDYTRWTALETFKNHPPNIKTDVWSFACVLWEILAIGGTPYGNIANNNDIPEHLNKGMRLSQLRYVGDNLYQIMLDCWQLIADERPKFDDLVQSLENLIDNPMAIIDFKIYSSFQYEQFYPNMELSVRPVF
ncbi:hypothetical protein ABEB36_010844 [Hypothenemus hampei]|uniref:Tyrosine-protein kinase Wsck n=1 Tax=Hypothenemus hampei TaxID=57062 RepID=A0ABD1EDA6_HYPHA